MQTIYTTVALLLSLTSSVPEPTEVGSLNDVDLTDYYKEVLK